MSRLRWALARLFAPEPVMRDPFPAGGGVFIYYRSDPAEPYRLEWVVKAERFRLKTTHRLAQLDFPSDGPFTYEPGRSFTRFVGTVGDVG